MSPNICLRLVHCRTCSRLVHCRTCSRLVHCRAFIFSCFTKSLQKCQSKMTRVAVSKI